MANTSDIKLRRHLGPITLVGDTFNLIEENFLIILQSFLLIGLTSLLFFGINHYYFQDISNAIFDHNFRDQLSLFPKYKIAFYASFLAILYLVKFCILMAPIKAFDNNISVTTAFVEVAKKIVPITLSSLLLLVIYIALIIWAVFFSSIAAINVKPDLAPILSKLNLSFLVNPFFKISSFIALACIAVFYLVFAFRSLFFYFVNLLDEEYYLKSFARSFYYTKSNFFSIFFKMLVFGIVCLPFYFIFNAIFDYLTGLITEITSFEKNSLSASFSNFFTTQLSLANLYLIYQFIKVELPQDYSFGTKFKVFLIANIAIFFLFFASLVWLIFKFQNTLAPMLNYFS